MRRESSVQGPLNPLQIKDIVLSKYRAVSKIFCRIELNLFCERLIITTAYSILCLCIVIE